MYNFSEKQIQKSEYLIFTIQTKNPNIKIIQIPVTTEFIHKIDFETKQWHFKRLNLTFLEKNFCKKLLI